jgi:uncharacterized membrane protein YhhN
MLPFPGGITGTLNGALVLSVAAACLYALVLRQSPSRARSLAKVLSTGLLAIIAWRAGGPLLLVATLALSVLGDWFLSRDGERNFIAGLASFLAAHVGYGLMFLPIGREAALPFGLPGAALMVLAVLAFAGFMLRLLVPRLPADMRIPVFAYIAAILAMGVAAVAFNSPVIAAGAALFMMSDAMIATEKFVLGEDAPQREWSGLFVWVTYYAAQVLLLFGVLALAS